VGVSIGGSGSVRDTLGLFVSSVIAGGPADKAGIIEGERIAAVNGVDVRVAREDIEDMSASSARVSRFTREVQKAAPGSTVTLRVFGNGRYREVSLKTVKMSELSTVGGWQMLGGDGGVRVIRRGSGGALELDGGALEQTMQQFRERMQDFGRDLRFDLQELPRRMETGSPIRVQALPRRGLTRV
jgi:C-terminal processing protease CtpA/Prc